MNDEVSVAEHFNYGWAGVCGDQFVIQCSKQRQVLDPSLNEQTKLIYESNPGALGGLLSNLGQYPAFASRDYYEKFSNFSFDQAMSLHKAAFSARVAGGKKSAEVNALAAELGQSAKVPKGVYDILYFNDVFFQPWRLIRGSNPGLAATRLGKDTDDFRKTVEEFEKNYQGQKQVAVQIDPSTLEQGIAGLKTTYKEYERAFNAYYGYLGKFFTDRTFPEFGIPDLSGFEVQAYTARAEQEMTAIKFKNAAKALDEMKQGFREMEQADQQLMTARDQTSLQQQAIVEKVKAFWNAHRNDPDLTLVLQEIEKAKKDYEGIQMGFGIADHMLPEKVKKAMLGVGGTDLYGQLRAIEEEVLAKQKQKQEETLFSDYLLTGPRVNTYDLSKAYGEVVLLPEQLRQGKISLTGWLSHVDGIDKILFSEDGGRTWQEIQIQQAVQVEFSPIAGKRYDPKLRIKTRLSKDYDLTFFPNITGLVYRDVSYADLVKDVVTKIANAYESQNTADFASLISRDYIGNRVYLEEGVRFDFDMFTDIRLKIYIDRIEKRGDLYVADTHWDKSQNPRKTGQQQMTTGKTVMMFSLEDGTLKIKNLRGNLIYATLSPEIAEASGLSQTIVEEIRVAEFERNPVQPGAGNTVNSGGVGSSKLNVRTGSVTAIAPMPNSADFDFSSGNEVPSGSGDITFEFNNIMFGQIQTSAQSFEALSEAPSGGYAGPITPLPSGTVIVFTTAEGYFGKMNVIGVNTVGANATLSFQYALQTDGSRNLST